MPKDRSSLIDTKSFEEPRKEGSEGAVSQAGGEFDLSGVSVEVSEGGVLETVTDETLLEEVPQEKLVEMRGEFSERISVIDDELVKRGNRLTSAGEKHFYSELSDYDFKRNRVEGILRLMGGEDYRKKMAVQVRKISQKRSERFDASMFVREEEARFKRGSSEVKRSGKFDFDKISTEKFNRNFNAVSVYRDSLYSKLFNVGSTGENLDEILRDGVSLCSSSRDLVICSGVIDAMDFGLYGLDLGVYGEGGYPVRKKDEKRKRKAKVHIAINELKRMIISISTEY